jgi:hypothetical protein
MPIIIFKFDDFTKPTEYWDRVMCYGIKTEVKFSIGIIGNSLEKADKKTLDWVKSFHDTGNFEFWNHGYTHDKNENVMEFYGTSADAQYSSLEKTQRLGKEKLGITFSTFGAPWNKTDSNTIQALEKIPEIKIWLHGKEKCKGKLCLKHSGIFCETSNVENRFLLDFDAFKKQYDEMQNQEYLVLQFHPNTWKKKTYGQFLNFSKILDYLKSKPDVSFALPNQFIKNT